MRLRHAKTELEIRKSEARVSELSALRTKLTDYLSREIPEPEPLPYIDIPLPGERQRLTAAALRANAESQLARVTAELDQLTPRVEELREAMQGVESEMLVP